MKREAFDRMNANVIFDMDFICTPLTSEIINMASLNENLLRRDFFHRLLFFC
jgi:hypothetical protein